jgi:hypothetical protein
VTGFAAVTWIVPPLGVLVTLLVVGWFLAIGVGAVLGMRGTKDQIPDANRT